MPTKDYRGYQVNEIPEAEKKLVETWLDRIKTRRESPEFKRLLKNIPKWRKYVRGRQYQELEDNEGMSKEDIVRANLIHSAIANAIPRVYAKNPEISVTPTEAVEPSRYELIRRFGLTAQIVLNNQFGPTQAKLKKRAKSNIRAGLTTSMGWLKVLFQRDVREDPIIRSRINDAQDNINRINSLIADLEDEEQIAEHEQIAEELKNEIAAYNENLEVFRSEGMIIDRVLTDNMVVSDDVTDTDSYVDANWLAERIPYTVAQCKEQFGFCPDGANFYTQKGKQITSPKQADSNNPDKETEDENDDHYMVYIWEVWHKGGNIIYTLCEGHDGYMRDPFTPKRVGERWYPYFLFAPLPADGEFVPMCFTEELIELQDEYNETRTNLREHRKNSIPHWVGLKDSVTEEDARKLANPVPFEVTLVDGDPGQPVGNYLQLMQQPPIDPAVYDTTQTRVDFELVSGQGDAARGVVAKPKTLGEAEIIEQGLATRMGEMQDVNEDLVQEIAQYSLEILLQELTPQQVETIVGPGAVWPQLDRESIFNMVQVEVKAGSTGKPDQNKEREVWTQFMPVIRETVAQVHELRQSGQDELADSLVKLIEEGLRRFDERIDIEEYFPRKQEGEITPQQMQQMQQQQEAMKQQAEMLRAQIAEIKAKTLNHLADAEAKEAGMQFDQYMEQMRFLLDLMNPAPGQQPTQPQPAMMQ